VFRYHIPFSKWLALVVASIVFANGWGAMPLGIAKPAVMALPMAYLVAFIGLCPIPKLPVYSRGDYSYGIYLYAYPLQQLLVLLFPGQLPVLVHFVLSVVAVTCVAMCSWHIVEKPILKSRKKLSFTARKGDHHIAIPKADPTLPESSAPGA
jgi:peptidoglycan/LPS O-acetylase OafA/YrhL